MTNTGEDKERKAWEGIEDIFNGVEKIREYIMWTERRFDYLEFRIKKLEEEKHE